MFNLFKKKKNNMLGLVNENGMYKLYNGTELIMWGENLEDILIYMESLDKENK